MICLIPKSIFLLLYHYCLKTNQLGTPKVGDFYTKFNILKIRPIIIAQATGEKNSEKGGKWGKRTERGRAVRKAHNGGGNDRKKMEKTVQNNHV